MMHPEQQFAGKLDRIAAGETPHPLCDPAGWTQLLDEAKADLQHRLDAERANPAVGR